MRKKLKELISELTHAAAVNIRTANVFDVYASHECELARAIAKEQRRILRILAEIVRTKDGI